MLPQHGSASAPRRPAGGRSPKPGGGHRRDRADMSHRTMSVSSRVDPPATLAPTIRPYPQPPFGAVESLGLATKPGPPEACAWRQASDVLGRLAWARSPSCRWRPPGGRRARPRGQQTLRPEADPVGQGGSDRGRAPPPRRCRGAIGGLRPARASSRHMAVLPKARADPTAVGKDRSGSMGCPGPPRHFGSTKQTRLANTRMTLGHMTTTPRRRHTSRKGPATETVICEIYQLARPRAPHRQLRQRRLHQHRPRECSCA